MSIEVASSGVSRLPMPKPVTEATEPATGATAKIAASGMKPLHVMISVRSDDTEASDA